VPSGEIDITNRVSITLSLEIWDKIFNYLEFQNLKLFTEHKVKVLKKPLNGDEDNNRLMMGEKFIFHIEDFLNVVKSVYSVALCCKGFYRLTQRERKLLINGAQWARLDKEFLFSEQIPTRNKQNKNKIDEIQKIVKDNERLMNPVSSSLKQLLINQKNDLFFTDPITAKRTEIVFANAIKHEIFTKNLFATALKDLFSNALINQEDKNIYQRGLLDNLQQCLLPQNQIESLFEPSHKS
jgi:hypothetical protein